MPELSVFCDESGGMNGTSRYRIVTLVFHNQENDIGEFIGAYERDLRAKSLPDIPFHAGPAMYGKGPYASIDIADRRRIFASFSYFQKRLPYRYKSFVYQRSEVGDESSFVSGLRRDLAVFLADNLAFFQA